VTVPAAPEVRLVALARLLSLGLDGPDAETRSELHALTLGLVGQGARDDELGEILEQVAAGDDPRHAHDALFGRDPACPPYEGSYETDPFRQARELADVSGFYRAFGAEPSGPAAERPDHAGCELEFLSFLVSRRLAAEAAGDAGDAAVCLAAEDAFLRDHLGKWLPAFCRDLGERAQSPFYLALARLGGRLVAEECARRGIEPQRLPRRRRLTVLEPDTVECGGAPVQPGGGDR
jgi:TorA maturation chaperone TorD